MAQKIRTVSVNLPPQSLGTALSRLAEQAELEMILPTELVVGKTSPAVAGDMSADRALSRVLTGSGLDYSFTGANTVIIAKPDDDTDVIAPDGSLLLETITIQAGGAMTEGTGSYASGAVTLMKGAQSLKEIPQSVTVITRQRMDDQRLDTVEKALANTPGVEQRARPGGGQDTYIRGFQTETMQYNGVPLSRYFNWGNELTASAAYLDRVEVLRGAQGLLEGAGNPAGSVNLVRKRGLDQPAFAVESRLGSWDTYGMRVDAGGPLDGGRLRSRAVLDYERRDSFLDTVQDHNLNGYLALDYDLTPDTTLGFGVSHARLSGNSALYQGVPRYADGTDLGLLRSAYVGAGWNDALRRETQIFADIEHRFNNDWKLNVSAAHIRDSWDATTSHAVGLVAPGTRYVTANGFVYDYGSRTSGIDINLGGRFMALGMEHDLLVGANHSRQKRDDGYLQYFQYTTYDVFNPDHDTPPLSAFNPTDDVRQIAITSQSGAYGMLRSHLTESATLILGARLSWYDFDVAGSGMGWNDASEVHEDAAFAPYAGYVHDLTPNWTAYASYARIFDPQTATDAERTPLPPTRGHAYEIGLKGELLDGNVTTALALYRVEQENRAVTDYGSPMNCGGWYCSKAAGKVRSEGFEAEIHGAMTPDLQISAGYTYNRNKILQDDDTDVIGTPFDYASPRHILRLWATYRLPGDRWTVGGGVNYQSERKTPSATMLNPVQGGYSVWNAMASYKVNDQWSAILNVENLFDKDYYRNIDNAYYFSYRGEPRKLTLTMRATF